MNKDLEDIVREIVRDEISKQQFTNAYAPAHEIRYTYDNQTLRGLAVTKIKQNYYGPIDTDKG